MNREKMSPEEDKANLHIYGVRLSQLQQRSDFSSFMGDARNLANGEVSMPGQRITSAAPANPVPTPAAKNGELLKVSLSLITDGSIEGHWLVEMDYQCNSSPGGRRTMVNSFPSSIDEALEFVVTETEKVVLR